MKQFGWTEKVLNFFLKGNNSFLQTYSLVKCCLPLVVQIFPWPYYEVRDEMLQGTLRGQTQEKLVVHEPSAELPHIVVPGPRGPYSPEMMKKGQAE